MKENYFLPFDEAKRVVVKVGSNVLTEDNGLNLKAIRSITRQIVKLIQEGFRNPWSAGSYADPGGVGSHSGILRSNGFGHQKNRPFRQTG